MTLIEVGFWRRFEDKSVDPGDLRPWPSSPSFASDGSDIDIHQKETLLEYLSLGLIESYEFGYATCRVCGYHCDEMGCCSLSDGIYVWPEGLNHYINEHDIILPKDFINHTQQNIETLRKTYHNRQINSDELCLSEWRESEKLRFVTTSEISPSFITNFHDKCCFCF